MRSSAISRLGLSLLMFLIVREVSAHPDEVIGDYQECKLCLAVPIAPDNSIGRPQWELNAGVPFVGSPVHENMTKATVTLSNVHGRKFQDSIDEAYIHGVFWNDDPEDLLCPECSFFNLKKFDRRWGIAFAGRFLDAKARARDAATNGKQPAFGIGDALLERSHFGDLQFLHGMASSDGEPAAETQAKILAWAEFAYKTATGKISQTSKLKDIPIKGVRDLFVGDARLESMTIEQLFGGKKFARRAAMGSLLHMIQDSYAPGHAERQIADWPHPDGKVFARGSVTEFHCYLNQDSDLHAADDKWPSGLRTDRIQDDRNPISTGAQILRFMYANGGTGAPWPEVEAYLQASVFAIVAGNAPAGPGQKYKRK